MNNQTHRGAARREITKKESKKRKEKHISGAFKERSLSSGLEVLDGISAQLYKKVAHGEEPCMRSSPSDIGASEETPQLADLRLFPSSLSGVKSSLSAAAGVKVTCAPVAVEAMRRRVAGAHPVLSPAL